MTISNQNGIINARLNAKLSVEELAHLMDVSVCTIEDWESGILSMTLDNLVKLSKVLNISPDMIIFGEENEKVDFEQLQSNQVDTIYYVFKKLLED